MLTLGHSVITKTPTPRPSRKSIDSLSPFLGWYLIEFEYAISSFCASPCDIAATDEVTVGASKSTKSVSQHTSRVLEGKKGKSVLIYMCSSHSVLHALQLGCWEVDLETFTLEVSLVMQALRTKWERRRSRISDARLALPSLSYSYDCRKDIAVYFLHHGNFCSHQSCQQSIQSAF